VNGATMGVRLTDGINIYSELPLQIETNGFAEGYHQCGLVEFESVAAKSVYFEGRASSGNVQIVGNGGVTGHMFWTIKPVTQNFPQAVVLPPMGLQTKFQTTNITTDTTDFLEFTGLTIGRVYKFSGQIGASLSGADSSFYITIREGTTDTRKLEFRRDDSPDTHEVSMSFYYPFVATATSVKLRTNSMAATDTVKGSSSPYETWANIETAPYHALTTEF